MGMWVSVLLLGWFGVSVLVGLAVGRVIRNRDREM